MTKNIVKTIWLDASCEDVWQALTDPKQISTWLMPTVDFKAIRGERFMLQAKPMASWDGKIYGEVLIVEAPHRLIYTWKGDQMKSNTTIEWILESKNNGTLLTMNHKGFTGFSDYVLGMFHAMGWGKFLKQLKTLVSAK